MRWIVFFFISLELLAVDDFEDIAVKGVFWGYYDNIEKKLKPKFAKKMGQSKFHMMCMQETYKLFGVDMSKLLEDKKIEPIDFIGVDVAAAYLGEQVNFNLEEIRWLFDHFCK